MTSEATVHACFNAEACNVTGARKEHVECNAGLGYAAGGVLCGLCAEGTHVRVGTTCVACDTSGAATTKAVAAGLAFVASFAAIFFFVTRPEPAITASSASGGSAGEGEGAELCLADVGHAVKN